MRFEGYRVSAGHDAAIGCQQGHALRIQIVFGNHVIAAKPLASSQSMMWVSAGSRQRRSLGRMFNTGRKREADPTAITVLVVHRDAELGMSCRNRWDRPCEIADDIFALAPFDLDMAVGVGPVARRRQQEGQWRPRSAARRAHHERHVVLMAVLREMGAVQAARQLLRHGEGEIALPAAVVEVVIVKMDSTVMSRLCTQLYSLPSQACPFMARVGRLTVVPCRPCGEISTTCVLECRD